MYLKGFRELGIYKKKDAPQFYLMNRNFYDRVAEVEGSLQLFGIVQIQGKKKNKKLKKNKKWIIPEQLKQLSEQDLADAIFQKGEEHQRLEPKIEHVQAQFNKVLTQHQSSLAQ